MNVLVVGDAMMDRWLDSNVTRLAPEDPIPIARITHTYICLGGAANVAENLRSLGVKTSLLSGTGGLIVKSRVCCNKRCLFRFDEEEFDLQEITSEDLFEFADKADAVIVSDYGKGSVGAKLIPSLREVGQRVPVFIDSKSLDPDIYASWATAVFPNQKQFIKNRVQFLLSPLVIEKRGAAGVALRSDKAGVQYFLSRAKNPIHVTGAGDTLIAAYVYKFLSTQKKNPESLFPEADALRFAMAAAAVAVQKVHTSTPTLREIAEASPTLALRLLPEDEKDATYSFWNMSYYTRSTPRLDTHRGKNF